MKSTDYPLGSRWRHAVWPLLLTLASSQAADRITGHSFATRSEVYAPHAMAATSQPLVTQIALETMRNGGSAVDAAIAADAGARPDGADRQRHGRRPVRDRVGSENAQALRLQRLGAFRPNALTLAEFQKRGLKDVPSFGPLPVSVPGCVDGWFALHDRFGKLPMKNDLAPTIRYAREGFPVSEVIAYYLESRRCRGCNTPVSGLHPRSSPATAAARAPARCGRDRPSPTPCRRLPTVAAMRSTRARSRT